MPRLTPLPEQLKYLQPFRKQVGALDSEEVSASLDVSLLNKLLCQRIEGMSVEDGKRLLQEDQEVLEKWIGTGSVDDNGGMIFLQGYLGALPDLVDRLLELNDEPQVRSLELHMDLPKAAKVKRKSGGLLEVNWLRAIFFVHPVERDYLDFQVESFRNGQIEKLAQVEVSEVRFGEVSGLKRLTDMSIVETVSAEYALKVPGGFAFAMLMKRGNRITHAKFSECEAKFEQLFHTIRLS